MKGRSIRGHVRVGTTIGGLRGDIGVNCLGFPLVILNYRVGGWVYAFMKSHFSRAMRRMSIYVSATNI